MIASPIPALSLPIHLQSVYEFEQWQRANLLDGSYKFVRGRIIEKEPIKPKEFDLIDFMVRLFIETPPFKQQHTLYSEIDSYVDDFRKRVPDLTNFNADQRQAIRRGERVNTLFAIEVLSDSEAHQEVLDKIQNYFDGGAKLVWYVIPKQQKIYVYTSPDAFIAYKGADLISAAPVVPDFQFAVAYLFA